MSHTILRVAAVTSTDPVRHYTWQLRVAGMTDLLQANGIEVLPHRLPGSRCSWKHSLAHLPPCDIVWLHRRILWPSEMRVLRRLGRPIVLDIDDPVGYSASAWGNLSLKNCLQFRATARHADVIFAATHGLVQLARHYNPNVQLVPLSADTPRQRMRTTPRLPGEPLRLLWMGARSTFMYLESIRQQLEEVGRTCPNVSLRVVGHAALHLKHLPVENIRWSPETEQDALATCHVGLAPMKKDRWTQAKAAFKPLQYLANGMPFIGSPVGVNFDLGDGGRQGLLADTPAEWVSAVQTLASDEERRLRMGTRGIIYIREHHAPEVLAQQVAAIFHDIGDTTPSTNEIRHTRIALADDRAETPAPMAVAKATPWAHEQELRHDND